MLASKKCPSPESGLGSSFSGLLYLSTRSANVTKGEEVARHLREAYRMYIDGKGTDLIAKRLNEANARDSVWQSKDGESWLETRDEWTAQKVLTVLRYDFYRGEIGHRGEECPEAAHPALID